MKYISGILFCLIALKGSSQQKDGGFELRGELVGAKNQVLILSYLGKDGKRVTDSTIATNGQFSFSGKIISVTKAFLVARGVSSDADPNSTSFYLEPNAQIDVKVEENLFKSRIITGSKTEKESEKLTAQIKQIKDTGGARIEKINALMQQFIRNNRSSYHSIYLLSLNKNSWPFSTIQSLYHSLDTSLYNTEHGKLITKVVTEVEDNAPGKVAKQFSSTDWKNAPIALEAFKGKYVLLDFWASWCVPCRQSTPGMIGLYDKFHKKGLEIISISVDNNLDAWKKAVIDDKTGDWYHLVSNSNSPAPERIDRLYGVSTYPTKILIDKQGIIIGRYTGTEEESLLIALLTKELAN